MWKTITKENNKKKIMFYYAIAVILIGVGLYTEQSKWYTMAAAFLGVAMFRKYWLHKRLEE